MEDHFAWLLNAISRNIVFNDLMYIFVNYLKIPCLMNQVYYGATEFILQLANRRRTLLKHFLFHENIKIRIECIHG